MDTLRQLTPQQALMGLGAMTAIPLAFRFLQTLYVYTRPSSLPRYRQENAYALVTGASDGIGRSLAHGLAKNGFNLILHGRNPTKLETVKADLQALYPSIKVRCMIIDASASKGMEQNINAAVAALSDLDGPLTVVINNAGGTNAQRYEYSALEELDYGEVEGMLALNALFPMQLTRSLMPLLLRNTPALLVDISSAAGVHPPPYLPLYTGTKALGEKWSVCMARTLQAQGVDVQAQAYIVGKVCATAHNDNRASFFEPTADVFAKACLDRVGCGRLTCAPFFPHALQVWGMTFLPEMVITAILRSIGEGLKVEYAERKKRRQ